MTGRNVLILSPELPAPDSGAPLRALQHLNLLNRIGYKPYLLSFFHRGQEGMVDGMCKPLKELTRETFVFPAPMPESRGFIETLSRNVRYLMPGLGAQLWRRGGKYEKNRYPLARAFDAAGAAERLLSLVREKEINLLLVMHAWLLHYLPAVRELRPSLQVVLDLVDLDSDLFAQLLKSRAVLSELARLLVCWITMRRLERTYFPMCDEFWAIAPTEAEKIRRLCADRPVVTLPSVFDVDAVSPCESDGSAGHLLFLGSLFFRPNENAVIHLLRKLYPRIRRTTANVHLTIVGRGLNSAVERLARQTPGVTLSGYVPLTRPFYEDAQVVVVPMREGCGVRVKILEALAMGRAVVATPKAAEGLEVIDGKHIVIADSDDAFVAATVDLLQRPERRRALGLNGRALVERRYSWQAAESIMATETCLRSPIGERGTTDSSRLDR